MNTGETTVDRHFEKVLPRLPVLLAKVENWLKEFEDQIIFIL